MINLDNSALILIIHLHKYSNNLLIPDKFQIEICSYNKKRDSNYNLNLF